MKTTYQSIKAFHPGETLDEKLKELELSVEEFSSQAGVPTFIVHSIIAGNMSITADIAYAFEQVTHIPARYWLNSQHTYDEYQLIHNAETYRNRLAKSHAQLVSDMVNSVVYIPVINHHVAVA